MAAHRRTSETIGRAANYKMYCKDFDDRITLHNEIKILPHIKDGVFSLYMK